MLTWVQYLDVGALVWVKAAGPDVGARLTRDEVARSNLHLTLERYLWGMTLK